MAEQLAELAEELGEDSETTEEPEAGTES